MSESAENWNTTERDWFISLSVSLKNQPKVPSARKAILKAFDERWSRWADSEWDSFIVVSKTFNDLRGHLKTLVDTHATLGFKALSSDSVIKGAVSIDWQIPTAELWIPVGDLHLTRPYSLDYVDSSGTVGEYTISAAGYQIPVQIAVSFRPTRVAEVAS